MGIVKERVKRFERACSRTVRAALRLTLDKPRPAAGRLDPSTVRRVLIVRQDSRLGNLLLLTPLLKGIRNAFSSAETDILVSDAYGEILRHNPDLGRIYVLPKAMFLPDPSLPWRLVRNLRRNSYDLVFDASAMQAFSLSSAALAALSGAERKVGFDRGDAGLFLNCLVPPPDLPLHETRILFSLLRHVAPGAVEPAFTPQCHLTEAEKDEGQRLWASWGLGAHDVAVFVGARAEKRWPVEDFLELARRILAAGRRCVFFAGPAEQALVERLRQPAGLFLAPPLPLRRFAAVLAQARAVVTADTGPMHLAVSLGVPTVEIFQGSEPWRFGYAHLPGHHVIDAEGRRPGVDEVWESLQGLLR